MVDGSAGIADEVSSRLTSSVDSLAGETLAMLDSDGDGVLTWSEFVSLDVIQECGGSGMVQLAEQAAAFQSTVDANADFYARKRALRAARLGQPVEAVSAVPKRKSKPAAAASAAPAKPAAAAVSVGGWQEIMDLAAKLGTFPVVVFVSFLIRRSVLCI